MGSRLSHHNLIHILRPPRRDLIQTQRIRLKVATLNIRTPPIPQHLLGTGLPPHPHRRHLRPMLAEYVGPCSHVQTTASVTMIPNTRRSSMYASTVRRVTRAWIR